MRVPSRTCLYWMILSLMALSSAFALADTWTKPTAEELQMTSEPAAPGAAAIILFRDERVDDKLHEHTTYGRIKILTEAGTELAIQEISYQSGRFSITNVEGRTIHSDGTIIPFTGKPYDKILEKKGKEKRKAIVFALPDVQVGSILEYRYTLRYDTHWVVSPSWYLQSDLYTRAEHFRFIPVGGSVKDPHGNVSVDSVKYSSYLPPGASIVWEPAMHDYVLDAANVSPQPQEEFAPPMRNISYRALFYYTSATTFSEFWGSEGRYWSKNVDRFIDSSKLAAVAGQLVSAADTPAQKARKIYAGVMKLENTNFGAMAVSAEDLAQTATPKTALDVWEQKRGSRNEITELFVGLVRAVGLKAYIGFVTNRDQGLFAADYFNLGQLNDYIAIVMVDDKEQFFDPGERYADFGQLHWKHASTQGIRQTDKGVALFGSPTPDYKSTSVVRNAALDIQPDGTATGTVRIGLTGCQALWWRELALRNSEDVVKDRFRDMVQQEMPPGIAVKLDSLQGLTEWDRNLVGALSVTGFMGMIAAKRVLLPAAFFASTAKPLFLLDKRTTPVDLNYPYISQDNVSIRLPATFDIESLPKDTEFSYAQNTYYRAKFTRDPGAVTSLRLLVIGNIFYKSEEYRQLKEFYDKVSAKDKEPIVSRLIQASALPSTPPGGSVAEVQLTGRPE